MPQLGGGGEALFSQMAVRNLQQVTVVIQKICNRKIRGLGENLAATSHGEGGEGGLQPDGSTQPMARDHSYTKKPVTEKYTLSYHGPLSDTGKK